MGSVFLDSQGVGLQNVYIFLIKRNERTVAYLIGFLIPGVEIGDLGRDKREPPAWEIPGRGPQKEGGSVCQNTVRF